MSQIDQFLSSLKRALKAKNVLYRDLAKALKLSESSVKRILSNKSLSLERLEEICRVADISFSEVVRSANLDEVNNFHVLSDEQEKALVENNRLLHYFMMLYDGKTPQKIEREYQIAASESKKYLFLLDRLNLIELHPRDKVKVKRHGFLRFRRDGAVGKVLFEQMKENFLNYDFLKSEEYLRFSFLKIGPNTLAKYKTKLEKMMLEMQEEAKYESNRGTSLSETGILFAFRPWQYSYMGAIKKKE